MDKYTVNTNNEYRAKINTGDLILLAKSNGNFDYYINKNNTVYSMLQ